MEKVRRQAKQYLSRQKKQQRWQKVVTTLAGMVVFCTTYALILPAITMTTPLVCETPEHIHTEECYTVETVTYERELVCGLTEQEPHIHDESCYTEETTYGCGLAETEPHTHGEGCYTLTRGELTCTLEEETVERQVERQIEKQVEQETTNEEGETVIVLETVYETVTETVLETVPHVHTDACYAWSEELTCGLEETEGHIHSEDCGIETVKVLTCGKEESEGHTHSDECWFIPENEGETEEILVLSCGQEEHIHDDNCYLALELEEKVKYYCGFDTEHIHTEECYFEDGTLKCTIPEHTHSEVCLEEPLPAPVPVELSESFAAESEDGAVVLTLHVDGIVLLPRAELDEEALESNFRLLVTQSEDMETYDEYAEMAAEEGEVMMVGVLDYTLTYDGEAVDLDACEVTVEVTPTEAFQEMLDAPEALGLMTLDLTDGLDGQEEEPEMELFFKAYTDRQGTVAYSVTKGANVIFYVQYYAWMERLVTEDGNAEWSALDVIDTSGRGVPVSGQDSVNDVVTRNLYIKPNGQLATEKVLMEIYKRGEEGVYDAEKHTSKFEYFDAPGLQYFNMVSNVQDIQYAINEIWIQKDGQGDPTSADPADWQVLSYEEGVTRFTNRPETAAANDDYVLIENGDIIRLIYTPKEKAEIFPADFYDYDISDGNHAVGATTMRTSEGTTNYGINGGVTYGTGTQRLGFGNANAGTTDELKKMHDSNGRLLNQYNRNPATYKGCAFGLVSGMNASGNDIIYTNGIIGPYLFGGGNAQGKTQITDIDEIQFKRVGDTYTLTSIPDTTAQNLDSFRNPGIYDGQKNKTVIWSNDFWPMDSANTWGAEGHDIVFGAGTPKDDNSGYTADGKKFVGATTSGNLPTSDDGKAHNAYFGMNFAVDFELTKNYIGPLEYYFFGDDDMWVFLSQVETDENGNESLTASQQIIDIGGIHSSVGQFVDLWDYISTDDWDADARLTYRLTFFYTERGASGSTCWMQFTLPTVVGVDLETQIKDLIEENTGTIRIEKQMGGIESNEPFRFHLGLEGADNYEIQYLRRDSDGQISTSDRDGGDAIGNDGIFELEPGEILVIHHLPEGTRYKITELADSKAGYHTEIQTAIEGEAEMRSELFTGDMAAETEGTVTPGKLTTVVFINTATYELPATGGAGTTLWYTMGALALLGAAYLMYKKRQWNLREGDGM